MKKRRRWLPIINGIKAPVFFHKDPMKRTVAIFASWIAQSQKQGWKKSMTPYEVAELRGELGTLQKFLDADNCETTTDGKLFNAYKFALVESDEVFRSLTDAVDWKRPRSGRKCIPPVDRPFTKAEVSQLLWVYASVHDFASFLRRYLATPPTLASVRYYFGLAFPRNAGLWPNDKNANHDMARKLRKWKLPLMPSKAGRPRNRGKLQK